MITIECGYRISFRNKIKQFCSNNNLKISYLQDMGNYDFYNIGGNGKDFDKLSSYINELENERNKKSFWYKLFN